MNYVIETGHIENRLPALPSDELPYHLDLSLRSRRVCVHCSGLCYFNLLRDAYSENHKTTTNKSKANLLKLKHNVGGTCQHDRNTLS